MSSLTGKVALVTGASRGIGRAIAEKALAQSVSRPTLIALSATILRRRKSYYAALEAASKKLEITDWLCWFASTAIEAQRRAAAQGFQRVVEPHILGIEARGFLTNAFGGHILEKIAEACDRRLAFSFREVRARSRCGCLLEFCHAIATVRGAATGQRDRQSQNRECLFHRTESTHLPPLERKKSC